jgi:hypothetical protein
LGIARHVADDEIELGDAEFESHTSSENSVQTIMSSGFWLRRWRLMPKTGTPLLALQPHTGPFMRHEYLAALHEQRQRYTRHGLDAALHDAVAGQ